ncbi:hypothetical protein VUR80DRAFT_4275 [Thermomyces stellatus]
MTPGTGLVTPRRQSLATFHCTSGLRVGLGALDLRAICGCSAPEVQGCAGRAAGQDQKWLSVGSSCAQENIHVRGPSGASCPSPEGPVPRKTARPVQYFLGCGVLTRSRTLLKLSSCQDRPPHHQTHGQPALQITKPRSRTIRFWLNYPWFW